ncbi:hypothetical protein [Roseateles sp.]
MTVRFSAICCDSPMANVISMIHGLDALNFQHRGGAKIIVL